MFSPSDDEVQAKAEELGVVQPGEPLPRAKRSRVVAALLREHQQGARAQRQTAVPVAESITVVPGQSVEVDGKPFPWVIQSDAIEVTLDPSGKGLVRLTIPTKSVQIIKPEEGTS